MAAWTAHRSIVPRRRPSPLIVPRGGAVSGAILGLFVLVATAVAVVVVVIAPSAGLSDVDLLVFGVSPAVLYAAFRMPVGALLGLAFVGGPLINYLLIPGNVGIPWQSGVPVAAAEGVLLVRMLAAGQRPSLRVSEALFLAAIGLALLIGVVSLADPRVVLSECVETTNLAVLAALLRGRGITRGELGTLILAANLALLPFTLAYLAQSFGLRAVDFVHAQTPTVVIVNVWVLMGRHGSRWTRLILLVTTMTFVVALVSASQRGNFFVAVAGSGVVLAAHSTESVRGAARSVALLLMVSSLGWLLLPLASELAPDSIARLSEGTSARTFTLRVTEAEDALSEATATPWGLGLGAVIDARSAYDPSDEEVRVVSVAGTFIHDSYAWYAAKTGFFGLVTMLMMVATALLAGLRMMREPERAGEGQLAVVLLTTSCIGAIGGPALHGFYYTTWAAVGLALATPAHARARSHARG